MKKYDLSKIMKRAWELVKKMNFSISEALKKVWKGEKDKKKIIEKLEKIADEKEGNGWHYEVVVSEWNNYGKSRTYFEIEETRDHSKHLTIMKYGYYDNASSEYVAGKHDIRKEKTE